MGIYSVNDSGTSNFHSRYTKSISNRYRCDMQFCEGVPVLHRFCLPGDVWRIKGQALVRFLPMVAPSMTPYELQVRYFFVPLRMIEENTELIITGSKNGKLYESALPVFASFTDNIDKVKHADGYVVKKHSFWDYIGVPLGDYEPIKDDKCLPAEYWFKAYAKIYYDYYRDENYDSISDDFETWFATASETLDNALIYQHLKKDYFTSALPWQLKGATPTLDIGGEADILLNFGTTKYNNFYAYNNLISAHDGDRSDEFEGFMKYVGTDGANDTFLNNFDTDNNTEALKRAQVDTMTEALTKMFKKVSINGNLGFNADEFRVMMAQTRIFERLARCGSRYTEYLYSNFGTAPADETLQRPKYLGGWKIPIVTSEVLQTAEDGSTPVGTMRGHGISRGGNGIKDFYCKEFGIIFGIACVMPKVEYTQGINRQLSYKERFDFFNPSFQHLSEQEVRNGELYISFTDNKNDETLGFQAYANELRSFNDQVVGDLRDSLAYWGSQLQFASRPNVHGLINSLLHEGSFNRPFVANSSSAYNIILQFYNDLDVYRPMVRYSTPGLVDHF